MRRVKIAAKIGGAVAVSLLVYRGIRLYLRNDITISITELVHLPPSGVRPVAHEVFAVQGKIECETCVMRSYRFLLKLSASLKCGISDSSRRGYRRRVMSSVANSRDDTFSMDASLGDTVDSVALRQPLPHILVEETHSMVDCYALETSGTLCFTPPCVAEELLVWYNTTTMPFPNSASHWPTLQPTSGSSGSSPIPASSGSIASRNGLDSTPLRKAVIHHCYLHADDVTPHGKQLSLEIEFVTAVHGATLFITLPSRSCRVLRTDTGGFGRVMCPNRQRPHHWVWEMGSIDGAASQHAGAVTSVTRSQTSNEQNCTVSDDYASSLLGLPSRVVQLTFVYEHLINGSGDDDDDGSSAASGEGEGRLSERLSRLSTSRSRCSTSRSRHPANAFQKSAPNSKARRRDERALRKREALNRRREGFEAGRVTAPARSPTMELSYSITGLVSGASIRKLQVVSEKPNWAPRSWVDRAIIRYLPSIESAKLRKFAHYTTWFVQPITISSL